MKMIFFNNDTSMGQRKKNSESLTGIEPMASQIPETGIWEAMGSIPVRDSEFFLCPMLVSLLKKIIFIIFNLVPRPSLLFLPWLYLLDRWQR